MVKTKEDMTEKQLEKIRKNLTGLISSGSLHTTLIGKIVSVNHSDSADDAKAIDSFVDYVVELLEKADNYGKSKQNGK